MPYLIDTHAHLDADIYRDDLDIVVKHALDEGVWIVTVGNDFASSKRAVEIAERYPEGVYAAVGLHPRHVGADLMADDKLLDVERFHELLGHPKVVAIGETGLDFHDLSDRPRGDQERAELIKANQMKVLGRFLDLAREFRLPLLLHCREAEREMLQMIETWDRATPGFDAYGVVHGFSGSWKDARRFFNLGFMISFTGIVTHGAYQTALIKKSPLSNVVIESDCPHMTPEPWRARRNEPSYLPVVAAAIAGIRGAKKEEVVAATTANAMRIFSKISR